MLVKPDGVFRALIGKAISVMEDAGLKVVAMKMLVPDKAMVGLHYADDPDWLESVGRKSLASYKEKGIEKKETAMEIGKNIRNMLIKSLTSGPVVAMVLEGNSAIFVARKLIGSTEPRKADPSSIRGRYGSDSYVTSDSKSRPVLTIVHASEDEKTAEREIPIWFKKSEILSYKRLDEAAIY